MHVQHMTEKVKVAIIGAGPAGLCGLRHLSKFPDRFKVTAFEQTGSIGGTWVYTDETDIATETGLPVHSSMYKNMRTNLPKEVMNYPGFPFSKHLPSFIHHSDFLEYLQQYAKHFDLYQYIQLYTQVIKVVPVHENEKCKMKNGFLDDVVWHVTTKNVITKEERSDFFDAVLVCNGHYFQPHHDIAGISNFKGTLIHSHSYRTSEPFQSHEVLIVGCGQSGIDIALDISTVAKNVHLSHRGRAASSNSPLPENIYRIGTTVSILENGCVQLENGDMISVDSIVLCTGYEYDFPFLVPECGIRVTNHRVHPLYKHVFNALYPSLTFIGINFLILPLTCFDMQTRLVMSVFTDCIKLPGKDTMIEDGEQDFQERLKEGYNPRHAHLLSSAQWDYYRMIAAIGKFPPHELVIEYLYEQVGLDRSTNVVEYKNYQYEIIDSEHWDCKLTS